MNNSGIWKAGDLEFSISLDSREGEIKNGEEERRLVQLHVASLKVEI